MQRSDDELTQCNLDLMETAGAVYLTTIGSGGFPQTRAMLNLRNKKQFPSLSESFKGHNKDLLAYLTTNTASAKMTQIQANPKVSLYFCNPNQFHGLTLIGEIEIIADSAIKRQLWQVGWERYYPIGVDDPDYSILCLVPTQAKGWYESALFEFDLSS